MIAISYKLVFAADLILSFDYASTVNAKSFLITYRSDNDAPDTLQQFRVTNTPAMVCPNPQGLPDVTNDTHCVRPPTCLIAGMYIFWVQAETEEGLVSEPSNLAACRSKGNCIYDCTTQITSTEVIPAASQSPLAAENLPSASNMQTALQQLADLQRAVNALPQTATPSVSSTALVPPPYTPV